MSLNNYEIGALIKLTVSFAVAGVATDPTSVTCTVIDPSGIETTPSPVHDSTGNYHATVDLTGAKSGVWGYRFVGTGACQAAMQAQFFVEPSVF